MKKKWQNFDNTADLLSLRISCEYCRVKSKPGACETTNKPHCRSCHESYAHPSKWRWSVAEATRILKRHQRFTKTLRLKRDRKPDPKAGTLPLPLGSFSNGTVKRSDPVGLKEVYICARCGDTYLERPWAIGRRTLTKCPRCGGACYPKVPLAKRFKRVRSELKKKTARRCPVCFESSKVKDKVCVKCKKRMELGKVLREQKD